MTERRPEFVERFASVLEEGGVPRMPARVFAALLATDSGRLTAAELAELLQISAAAVSGAVRYLIQVSLVSREREPGSRRDVYRLHERPVVRGDRPPRAAAEALAAGAREGVEAVGADTPAGRRLAETAEFFASCEAEMPRALVRWRAQRSP